MTDQTKEEAWVELSKVMETCTLCKHNHMCRVIEDHTKSCFNAKYRFRCPVEVLDERTEDE